MPPVAPLIGPSATPTAPAKLPRPTASPTQRTDSPAPTAQAALSSSTLATVNDQVIAADTARIVLAADRAVGRLLGQPPTDERDLVDRLVNTELVRQAAETAGFRLSDAQVTQALAGFLASRGKTQAELATALAAEALGPADFQSYFGRLILVDQFTQAQAKAQEITVAAYLKRLQGTARISFGPAASQVALSLPTTAPTARPAATAMSVQPTPAPMADVTRGVEPGQAAPSFDLPVLNDAAAESLTLDRLAGKPVVLSFWTTWCPYCRGQTPVLVAAHAAYAARGVQFAGINVKETQPQVQDYLSANGILYPTALDFGGQVAGLYNVTGFPTTYFLDGQGRIVNRHVGQLTPEQLDRYLAALLARGN